MSEKRPVEDEVMSFIMGENEILRDYRTAANKRKQVQILADLNGCTKRQMAEFLISRGEGVDKRFVQEPRKRSAEHTPAAAPGVSPEPESGGDSMSEHDPVNHPAHYTAGGVECIDAIRAALTCQTDPYAAWLTGQVIKYLWRWPMKNGVEDLEKARFYLDRLIQEKTT